MLDLVGLGERLDRIFIGRENHDSSEADHFSGRQMPLENVGDVTKRLVVEVRPRRRHDDIPAVVDVLTFEQCEKVQRPLLFGDVALDFPDFRSQLVHNTFNSVAAATSITATRAPSASPTTW